MTPPRWGGAGLRLAFGLGLALVIAGSERLAAARPAMPAARGGANGTSNGASAGKSSGTEAQRRARRLFEDAETHFRAGLFAEALGEYQAGYEAASLPGFLINIAQCQRRLGNLTAALTTYRKFIMMAPDSPYVPQVRSLVADLEKLASDADRERERAATTTKSGARATDPDGGRLRGRGKTDVNPALPRSSTKRGPSLAPRPPADPPAPVLVDVPAPAEATPSTAPVAAPTSATATASHTTTSWWWWGGVAAVVAVAGGTAAVFALRSGDTTTLHEGSLGTLRR